MHINTDKYNSDTGFINEDYVYFKHLVGLNNFTYLRPGKKNMENYLYQSF